MKYLRSRITEVEYPAKDHALLRFACCDPIAGRAGEFIMIRGDWGVHPVLPRAFSLLESGATGAVLVKATGEGSTRLAALREGDELVVFGPLGNGFTAVRSGRRPVLVAGGVGVAPLLFLARQLAQSGERPLFLYGARSEHDLPLAAAIEQVAELIVTTENGAVGERGLITAPLQRQLAADSKLCIYSCGPDSMLRAVASIALAADIPCQLALEAPMACGVGTCKGCAVMASDGCYRYVCKDGPVFAAADIYGAVS